MPFSIADPLSFLHRLLRAALFAAAAVPAFAAPQQPDAAAVLATLRPVHPRLLATDADFDRLKPLTSSGEGAAWLKQCRREAEELFEAPPSKYEIPDGKRLLATSRRVLERTLTLGLVHRLTGDRRCAGRLWRELDAAAHFKDWNPSHFLDTAEMTAAFAIGYDWLFNTWTAEQKSALRTAIVEMGLKQSREIYRRNRWWAAANHNWNQVCNGGMTLGALAVAEDERGLAGEIIAAAVASVPRAMQEFAPDGAWGEGPGYWDYAVMYNVFMLAALDSALGTDFGLSQIEGFSKAADFPMFVTGPTGRAFNYADAGDKGCGGPHILWLASKFSRPDQAAWRLERSRRNPGPLDLLYGAPWLNLPPASVSAPPLAKYFRGSEVVTLRSAWNDPRATCVAFKAGDNKVNHGHLDLGSFVLEAAGQRWAVDPGADDYNLPGYFGKQRWDYYRLRAEGHNTLVIAPDAQPDQSPRAEAKIVCFSESGAFAVADLSPAYERHAKSVMRGVCLHGQAVLVQDEIQTSAAADVWWFLHTGAKVKCRGTTAVFTQDGETMTATLLSPPGAVFTVRPAQPFDSSPQPARQQVKRAAVSDLKKLAIHLPQTQTVRLAVQFSPGDKPVAVPALRPLHDWKRP